MILSKIVFSVEARHRVSPAGARRHRSFANAYHRKYNEGEWIYEMFVEGKYAMSNESKAIAKTEWITCSGGNVRCDDDNYDDSGYGGAGGEL